MVQCLNGYLEDRASEIKPNGETASAGNSVFAAAADHVHPIVVDEDHVHPLMVDAPASAGADGVKGQIAFDSGYIYVCVDTKTWKRAALSTWT